MGLFQQPVRIYVCLYGAHDKATEAATSPSTVPEYVPEYVKTNSKPAFARGSGVNMEAIPQGGDVHRDREARSVKVPKHTGPLLNKRDWHPESLRSHDVQARWPAES
jgi:hypothetical protein